MPVALLNEIVLMGLGMWLGYKVGSKKEQLTNIVKNKVKSKG